MLGIDDYENTAHRLHFGSTFVQNGARQQHDFILCATSGVVARFCSFCSPQLGSLARRRNFKCSYRRFLRTLVEEHC